MTASSCGANCRQCQVPAGQPNDCPPAWPLAAPWPAHPVYTIISYLFVAAAMFFFRPDGLIDDSVSQCRLSWAFGAIHPNPCPPPTIDSNHCNFVYFGNVNCHHAACSIISTFDCCCSITYAFDLSFVFLPPNPAAMCGRISTGTCGVRHPTSRSPMSLDS